MLLRLTLVVLICGFCSAQPEMKLQDTPATFNTRVNLVLVPAVVRDRQGRAIGTLQQSDFRLFDNGKPQVITKFSLEKTGVPAVAPEPLGGGSPGSDPVKPSAQPLIPQRFVAYLFDDVHLSIGDLAQARDAADRQFRESPDPGSRFAIYTTSGRTTLDFTGDPEKLHETLLKIQSRPSGMLGEDCPNIDYYIADLLQNKNDPSLINAIIDDTLLCPEFASVVAPTAAAQAALRRQAENLARSIAARTLNLGDADTRLALRVLSEVVRRIAAMPGARSVVLVSPGFLLTDQRREESDIMDRAIRSNVTVNTLDARGLYAIVPGGDASRPQVNSNSNAALRDYQRQSASASSDILAELADATGGTDFHNNNDLREGFRRTSGQPEYYYILGFSPQSLKLDGRFHTLKVALVNSPGTDLQARRGFYAPLRGTDPQEVAKQDIEDALFSRDEVRDIPVDLTMQFFKSGEDSATLSVLARVDVRHLRFRKADGRSQNTLTILSGVFDQNGNYVTGIEKVVDMSLRDQTLESMINSGMTVKTSFDVMSGTYVVRLVVRDNEGQMMGTRNGALEIP